MPANGHVHLVGSINLPTAEIAMTTAADVLGDRLLRLPDGEPGPRRGWIFYQRPMFTHHRQLEARGGNTARPDPMALRMPRPGVTAESLEFPELGYAREAQQSYSWFRRARSEGRIPSHLRFQVSLPTPLACLFAAVEHSALPVVEPAYEAAMLREVATICAAIPPEDLAIQWDVCIEMILYDGRAMPLAWDDDAHRARFRRLTAAVPSDVHLGVHLCYGDYDGKHIVEPEDGTALAGLANLVTEEAARPLQWIHLPVPVARDDDAYFAPLAALDLDPATEVFLGLVHHGDGVEGAQRRIAAAEAHVGPFGISTECGIGRAHTTSEVEELFGIHAAATG